MIAKDKACGASENYNLESGITINRLIGNF